jgi:hypothetical protein
VKPEEKIMDRRTLLKAVAGAGTLAMSQKLAAPALAQGAAARTLRFVPQSDPEPAVPQPDVPNTAGERPLRVALFTDIAVGDAP